MHVMTKSGGEVREAITFVDRISDLPESLLCHILFFMDPKQGVATSILSWRWECLWKYVDILEFDNTYSCNYADGEVPRRMLFPHFAWSPAASQGSCHKEDATTLL